MAPASFQECENRVPMESYLFTSPPPRRNCHAGGARVTFTEENPLRWDSLSRGRGLFLKQTHPSTLEPDSHGTTTG